MGTHVECKDQEGLVNTGADDQCYLGLTTKFAVAPDMDFGFDTLENLKDKEEWIDAISEKQIYPLYEAEELALANTEPTFYEGRRRNYKTTDAKPITTFRSVLSLCSYRALKRFDGKAVRVYELTEDRGVRAVNVDDKFKGQKAILQIGLLEDPVADGVQSAIVTVNYTDKNEYYENGVNAFLDGWGDQDINGIFDVNLVLVSASATSIKFKTLSNCGSKPIRLFESGDVVVKNTTGVTQVTSFVAPDADGIYEVTGTDFANNFTVELNGVVTKGGYSYEAVQPLLVTGIS